MDSRFHKELEQLKVKVLRMAAYAERAVERALAALAGRDAGLAARVIEDDKALNALECEVDTLSLRLLALDQPVALDLRYVVACMRLAVDLERIGDEAVNIAEQAIALKDSGELPAAADLAELGRTVLGMCRLAVRAFTAMDEQAAGQVRATDDLADDLNLRVLKQCLQGGAYGPGFGMDRAVRTVVAARAMERVGDLATNVAEAVVFVARGVSIKHHCQGD